MLLPDVFSPRWKKGGSHPHQASKCIFSFSVLLSLFSVLQPFWLCLWVCLLLVFSRMVDDSGWLVGCGRRVVFCWLLWRLIFLSMLSMDGGLAWWSLGGGWLVVCLLLVYHVTTKFCPPKLERVRAQ